MMIIKSHKQGIVCGSNRYRILNYIIKSKDFNLRDMIVIIIGNMRLIGPSVDMKAQFRKVGFM